MSDNIYTLFFFGILTGIGATVAFDIWGLLLKFTFKIQPSNICVVGRWFLYMKKGKFAHKNLAKEEPIKNECLTGWIAHYIIGSSLGTLFLLIAGNAWKIEPVLLPALIFGILTVAAPLFLMQPSFGFGFAGSKTPNPAQTRLRSILNHTAFGFGLYLTALLINLTII